MFTDTDYYSNDLLRKLIPNFPPRICIGFYYQTDIDTFNDAMDDWENADTNDPADFESDMYDFEAWMPEARGYWDTGYDPCVWIDSINHADCDNFNFEEFGIGEGGLNPKYSRSAWLREVVDAISDSMLEWEWTEEEYYYPSDFDGEPNAFAAPVEMLLFKHHFLDWYDDWVKQGRPVRTLDFNGNAERPIIGELEYENAKR